MAYTLTPSSASLSSSGEIDSSLELTEPMTGTVGGTVTLKSIPDGVGDTVQYEIDSVTCDDIGELVNGGADLIITKTKTSFTFRSAFLDLFDRVYKYTKVYENLEAKWKNINMIGAAFTANGTTTLTITIDNSLPVRVGDTVTITGGLTTTQKLLRGTWPITSVGGKTSTPQNDEAFTTMTIKLNAPISSNTQITEPYTTYHTTNRARYVIPGIDTGTKTDSYNAVYEFRYPPASRLIRFNVRIKVTGSFVSGVMTPGNVSYVNVKWAFRYLSNFNQTMGLLTQALNRGDEVIAAGTTPSAQGYVSLDDSIITTENVSISKNGSLQYTGT